MLALLLHKLVPPVHPEQSAVKRPKVVELDDYRNAVSPPATSAEARFFLEDYRPLRYRAEAPRLGNVDRSSTKKRTLSSSMMMLGRQRKKVMRGSLDEKDIKVGVEIFGKDGRLH